MWKDEREIMFCLHQHNGPSPFDMIDIHGNDVYTLRTRFDFVVTMIGNEQLAEKVLYLCCTRLSEPFECYYSVYGFSSHMLST